MAHTQKGLVFICRKCGHNLFLSNWELKIQKMFTMNCPDCGEEAEENWILSRFGNYKKEYS